MKRQQAEASSNREASSKRKTSMSLPPLHTAGFPDGSGDKESTHKAGDLGSIPGLGRSPGEGHGNPLQSSCPENPMDRGAWWAAVQGLRLHISTAGHMGSIPSLGTKIPHSAWSWPKN